MKLSTFTYSDTNQATLPNIPLKHPDRTLVIMFGPSHLLDAPAPVQSVLSAYPGAAAIGCSSSGEIFGTHIQDDTLVVALLQFDHTTVRTASHLSQILGNRSKPRYPLRTNSWSQG